MPMTFGAWIHDQDALPLDGQIAAAAAQGITSARCYHLGYAEAAAPALRASGMRLFAGMWVDSWGLAHDWRSQVHLDELARYHELGVPLDAICVGNELREGGDHPSTKTFTARLSFGLANLLATYREWLAAHGYATPLTYAMEDLAFDAEGGVLEWVWPLVEACDVVSVNRYPMGSQAWFTFGAFEESRRFLHEPRARNDRLVHFEARLRRTLQDLERVDRPLILSETGFPSAVGYHIEEERLVVPESDNERFGEAMRALVACLRRVDADYAGRLRAAFFYEWRDNLRHAKIDNIEQSPIHVAFGLCDHLGAPKLDIAALLG